MSYSHSSTLSEYFVDISDLTIFWHLFVITLLHEAYTMVLRKSEKKGTPDPIEQRGNRHENRKENHHSHQFSARLVLHRCIRLHAPGRKSREKRIGRLHGICPRHASGSPFL